jgi:hypothetical protein
VLQEGEAAMNFREAVKAALKGPVVDVDGEMMTQWDGVLRDFAAILNEEELVFAFVRRGATPSVRYLVLAPKGRRDQETTELSMAVTLHAAVVLAGEHRPFTTIDEFEKILVRFAARPSFRESLDILKANADEPVFGFLRFGHATTRNPSHDVLVKISPEEQHRLADAAEASPRESITIRVDPTGPSPLGRGTYDPNKPPRWMVAGGYQLAVEAHHAERGSIQLHGTPEPVLEAE